MVKTHRAIQQWDHWLLQPLGNKLLEAEKKLMPKLTKHFYGKNVLLIGVPHQKKLLHVDSIPYHILLSPLFNKNHPIPYIESEFIELPIASGSVDLVIVPHTLEYLDNPRKLLMEACRIVKPEGHIIIFGFNPYSLWGLRRKFTTERAMPWINNFIAPQTVKKWLRLADFELRKQEYLLFRPPLQNLENLYKSLKLIEWIGNKFWAPLGGVYMIIAKAKVIPLTPIKIHWTQPLSGIPVSTAGPSIRTF